MAQAEGYFVEHRGEIDFSILEQILQMDTSEADRDFSKQVVFNYFHQASNTFQSMQQAMQDGNLSELSSLGLSLKDASETVGMMRVRDCGQVIQHLGNRKDRSGTFDLEENDNGILRRIKQVLDQAVINYNEGEKIFRKFYHEE